jgi:hypothetical protein
MWFRPRSRIHHWNCSRFADFVRGEKKPFALEWGKWDEWKKEQRNKRPIRFWLAEKGLAKLQGLVMLPIDIYRDVSYYVDNCYITKTHYLKTDLKPGHYYELDYRILHGLFNELVDFVEIEYANMAKYIKKNKVYKFKNGRCKEAGLDYLNWACYLKYGKKSYGIDKSNPKYGKPTPQALAAIKIQQLYNWWKDRPNRPEPMTVAGLSWDQNKEDNLLDGKVTRKELSNFKKLEKIEADYEKEDTKMLIELIKIRGHLWT